MQTPQQAPIPVTVLPPPRPEVQEQALKNGQLAQSGGSPFETQVPRTKQEYSALIERKEQLSNQLTSAQSRRDRLARQLEDANGVSRSGLESRIQVLDARLIQLERDISVNSSLIALAPTNALTTSRGSGGGSGFPDGNVDFTAISVVFTLFVLSPIAFTLARNLWRRGNRPAAPLPNPQNDARMERVEQAVDAIAIEVERMNEGQRFVTQLLSKQQGMPALGVGQAPAEPIRVPNAEAIPLRAEPQRSY